MFDLIYRFDPSQSLARQPPGNASEAQQRLEEGNREFVSLLGPPGAEPAGSRVILFDLEDIGVSTTGWAHHQQPFAVVLGCSDARVPTELIFSRACNEMFVVRVAGNVLGREVLGSIDYAVDHMAGSLRLMVVLGHSQCGAVTAAVDAFLAPAAYLAFASSHTIRAIVNGVFPAVHAAVVALNQVEGDDVQHRPGYRKALIETAVVLNASMSAAIIQQEFVTAESGVGVVFGVYDLLSRRVQVPLAGDLAGMNEVSLMPPPQDLEGFAKLGKQVAGSDVIRALLHG